MIDSYSFGKIEIKGRVYQKDVEVDHKGEVSEWRREKGHVFLPSDLERALRKKPDTVVLGTGAYGVARVPQQTRDKIQEQGARLVIDKTEEAVRVFNLLRESRKGGPEKVIGLFHLTC